MLLRWRKDGNIPCEYTLVLLLLRSHHTPHLLQMGFSPEIVLWVFFPSSIRPPCSLWTERPPRPGALRALSFLCTSTRCLCQARFVLWKTSLSGTGVSTQKLESSTESWESLLVSRGAAQDRPFTKGPSGGQTLSSRSSFSLTKS